ncbi:hypothetical protein [Curtobacterium sp. VKM Ac-2922]|uniref:hypothetical protein n=1 Tax=Curtobacterium sp. VKM Ac-2922 TaxID=2929475 RepID=UPI001FB245D0|nr:hypothetical protein [Curtobacterium sp. VKM Ac-2922]MCJ1713004.1 hypothetical protein [Curtobacterium sp. VKM Ac-2922]
MSKLSADLPEQLPTWVRTRVDPVVGIHPAQERPDLVLRRLVDAQRQVLIPHRSGIRSA